MHSVGTLVYGDSGLQIEFDDRVLAHIQVVVIIKLRRNEGFAFSWKEPTEVGDGRSSIWVHPAIPLYFKFSDGKQPPLNRAWLELLTVTANSAGGLRVVEEPPEAPPVTNTIPHHR